ncbi:MAG: alpha/beta hydrolase [Asticcacaulis sp.]|uniref:alpha/beta hydrolase n=1 Tax=Asticcacaulis sp. TaxID=1872648 RepID=UPI0039E4A79D
MPRFKSALFAACLLALPATAFAGDPGLDAFMAIFKAHPPQPVAAPDIKAIPLSNTGSPDTTQWEIMEGYRTARNVTQPALYPVLPATGTANGTAVIIAPGGAFLTLAFDTEGMEVAKYLAARGITCFVLTYRVDQTPRDIDGLAAAIANRVGKAPAKMTHGDIPAASEAPALADGLAAMTYVRSHAADYGIDAKKIGFMGFSAGGMETMNVATRYDAATRPDFIGVIYGAMHDVLPPADAPPAFIAVAADDPLLGYASVPIFDAWREAGKSAELHIYAHGGHGFGMRKVGTSAEHWIDDYYNWLIAEHLTTVR